MEIDKETVEDVLFGTSKEITQVSIMLDGMMRRGGGKGIVDRFVDMMERIPEVE
jgi:pyocin large subunit-like protein